MHINIKKALLEPLPEYTVGHKLRKQRLLKRITKKDLAEFINSTPKTIDSYEFNRSYPSPKRLVKIAKYLDTSLEYFFDDYYEFIFNGYSEKIKVWRKENKLSLRDAARILDINPATLDKWEKGDSYPDRVSYEKLINVFKDHPVK